MSYFNLFADLCRPQLADVNKEIAHIEKEIVRLWGDEPTTESKELVGKYLDLLEKRDTILSHNPYEAHRKSDSLPSTKSNEKWQEY